MEKRSREKLGCWGLWLGLFLVFLCVFGSSGQEIGAEEVTYNVLNEEATPAQTTRSRIQFPKDRKPSGISKRIIGGNIATPNAYPFQVALYILVEGALYFCGGTLLTTQWILTAAHCVEGASSVLAILGAHDISQMEATIVVFNSSVFIIHEGWDESILQNDIALIRLPENVTLNSYISTVELAQGSDSYTGILGRCLGWGRTILGVLSSVLRYVDAEVITNENCSSYEEYASYIVDHHLCTSGEGIVGSCNGDSGGPLIINGTQVGIVSFGVTACAAGMPSVFTRVTEFHSWITDNIGNWTDSGEGNGSQITVPFMGGYIGVVLTVMFLNYLR